MTGYVRVDTSNNIADGNVISAADLDNEFDGIQAAFNASTGHNHDGTTGEGAPISVLGPTQDVVVGASTVTPKTTNTVDIGSSSLKFKDLFLAGNASIGGTLGVTGATTLSAALTYGGVTLSNAVTGTGNMVLSASPTLTGTLSGANASLSGTLGVTGVATLGNGAVLGTPASVTLTNGTGLPISTGVSGLGTGVATALAVNVGSAGAPVINGGALGTPSSGTVTNLTGTASININGTVGATTATTGAFTTLAASGAVTLSGGTANGVAYLNGSKVLTTGSALQFDGTNLGVGGVPQYAAANRSTLNVNGTSTSLIGISSGGTTTSASYWYWDGTNASLFSTGQLLFGASNAEQMRLTSTGLGIGTSSPGQKLHVVGTGQFNALQIGANNTDINQSTSNPIVFKVLGTEYMRLDSSGNLGLGVTPSAWGSSYKAVQFSTSGSVSGNSGVSAFLANNGYSDGSNWRYLTSAASVGAQLFGLNPNGSGGYAFFTAPSGTAGNAISFTQAMTLDASGNLVLGATSANARLDVVGGSIRVNEDSIGTKIITVRSNFAGIGPAINVTTSDPLLFLTANTERARIDSSGNLLVGTTSSDPISAQVNGLSIRGAVGDILASAGNTPALQLARRGSDGGVIQFYKNTTAVGSVSTTSVLTTYNTTSDYRLKTVIGAVSGAGQRIDALEPVEYEWKSEGSRTRGFLAHKFQEVYPQSVSGEKDAVDADGKPVYQNMQAGTSEVIADLVAEIQSLRKRLAAAGI